MILIETPVTATRLREDLSVCPKEPGIHQLPAVLCGGAIEAPGNMDTLPAASLTDNLHKRLELLIA